MTVELSKNSRIILEKRYLKDGETPEKLFKRVAKAVASAELNYLKKSEVDEAYYKVCMKEWQDKFYGILEKFEFLPNSPTLFNAGIDNGGTLSGCFHFVIPDDLGRIFDIAKNAALVMKHGGGVGYCFSNIRPKNFPINSTHGKAFGPVALMELYHVAGKIISQGGKRDAAMMAILHISHPDIEEFISCKENNFALNNYNISVAVTDDFMKAVNSNQSWNLVWNGKVVKTVQANELFNKIINHAWKNGDPGLFFIDEANKHNPTPWLGEYKGTNPCGEQVLLDNESCNLGSINLSKFVVCGVNTIERKEDDYIDWSHLKEVTEIAVRFLDNVIDINNFPVDIVKESTLKTRKIGLGVMGWADMLVKLQIPYDSDKAVKLGERIMEFINESAKEYSIKLGKERGSYPALVDKKLNDSFNHGCIRNATRTTIAPTGCQTKENTILTDGGIKSIKQILEENKIDYEKVEKDGKQKWIEINNISLPTRNGTGNASKIFYNGKQNVRKITFEDGKTYEFTYNHPLLVNRNGKEIWTKVEDLVEGDDIVQVFTS